MSDEFLEDWEYAKKHRESMERYSGRLPHGADRVSAINALTKADARAIHSVEDVLGGLRNMAQLPRHKRETAIERIEKADSGEGFNRLHPSSRLAREHPFKRTSPVPVQGVGGERFSNPRLDPRARQDRGSRFATWDSDPGNKPGNYFEPAEGAPRLRAARLPDPDGRVRGDNEGNRHEARGELETITRDLKWVLENTRKLIQMINDPRYARGRV